MTTARSTGKLRRYRVSLHEPRGGNSRLRGMKCLGKLDMPQGYWQMPVAAEAQEVFTIATPEGLFSPTRVSQGISNTTAYFQRVMTELLAGLNSKAGVDDT